MNVGWFFKALSQYADFHQRARRKEFWWFVVIEQFIIWFLLSMTGAMALGSGAYEDGTLDQSELTPSFYIFGIATIVAALVLIVPYFAVSVRRMHDTGRSGGWVIFLLFLPIVVWIIALFDGQAAPNKYGPDPKELER